MRFSDFVRVQQSEELVLLSNAIQTFFTNIRLVDLNDPSENADVLIEAAAIVFLDALCIRATPHIEILSSGFTPKRIKIWCEGLSRVWRHLLYGDYPVETLHRALSIGRWEFLKQVNKDHFDDSAVSLRLVSA